MELKAPLMYNIFTINVTNEIHGTAGDRNS